MHNSGQDLATLHALTLKNKVRRAPTELECYWTPPSQGVIKLKSQWGVLLRIQTGEVVGTLILGLGNSTNYVVESKGNCRRTCSQWWSRVLGSSVPTQQQLKEAPLLDLTKNNEGNVAKRVSFADKVRGAQPQQLDLDSLPVPEMKGNMPMIKLPKQALERGKLYRKYSLVGRLDFEKLNVEEVGRIALETWKPKGDWKIIPLGKGFS
ncbi:hypothetical protein IFM89_038281 [Coptis chinensis]|uniref:Uncharacterized protein n=1 Tax=Coptis chinensis TaxID=261450 RepID=A0A835M8J9_9MAGN|nr:hypothetical protein IFM89_038281 [Coptis chinensis]